MPSKSVPSRMGRRPALLMAALSVAATSVWVELPKVSCGSAC